MYVLLTERFDVSTIINTRGLVDDDERVTLVSWTKRER